MAPPQLATEWARPEDVGLVYTAPFSILPTAVCFTVLLCCCLILDVLYALRLLVKIHYGVAGKLGRWR
jgi:hypothetical protein